MSNPENIEPGANTTSNAQAKWNMLRGYVQVSSSQPRGHKTLNQVINLLICITILFDVSEFSEEYTSESFRN